MTVKIERDEWQVIHGSRTAERAAEFFGIALADAIVERQPDDPRWPNEPVWRVKRKRGEHTPAAKLLLFRAG